MRSLFQNKRLIVFFAVLALGALTILATSLNEVPFREAQRFLQEETAESQASPREVPEVWTETPTWKHMLIWVLAGLLIVLVGLLVSPELRKQMLRLFIRVAFTFWAILFFFRTYSERLLELNMEDLADGQPGVVDNSASPMPVFEPPQVASTFSYLISFAIALFLLVIAWVLYRGWKKYVQRNNQKPLDELVRIARSSLDDLSSGRNSSDVIINCYLRMSDVVSDKRQLQRAVAMTPHEFAVRLEQAGLPGDAVRRLTQLFEAVRYGDRKSGPRDVNEAVSCLNTILRYCGEPV